MQEIEKFAESVARMSASPTMVEHRATVRSVSSGSVTVRIDGSTVDTVCSTRLVTCHVGDRVIVTIDPKRRSATVKGNLTNVPTSDADSDYLPLANKPSIESVELTGDVSLSEIGAQPALVSGTNIKTVNNESLLGSGNIAVSGLPSGGSANYMLVKNSNTSYDVKWAKQPTLQDVIDNDSAIDEGAIYIDEDGLRNYGALPVAYGGTGAYNAAAARTNLGLATTTGSIAIDNSPVNGTSGTRISWSRYGNVVSGYFSCKLSAAISAWNYARLGSSGQLPAPGNGISMYWPVMLDGNGSTQAAFNLGSNGVPYLHMRGGTGASGNVFHGSFCYVCADGA